MKLRPFPFTFKLVISYQISLGILVLCMSGVLVIAANLFLTHNTQTTANFNFSLYAPQTGMALLMIAILLCLFSLWGLIAAIKLFSGKRWAWVASLLWHGLLILPLILLVIATFSGSDILAKALSSFMLIMSFFSLIYLNKPSVKRHFFNNHGYKNTNQSEYH